MNAHVHPLFQFALNTVALPPDDYSEMYARRRMMQRLEAEHRAKHPDDIEPPVEREVQTICGTRIEVRVER